MGEDVARELERRVILTVLDRKWREHLYEMDYLRDGIGLRAMAQRDPLVEYQREGYDLFMAMMDGIKEETVGYVFNVDVQVEQPAAVANGVVADATGSKAGSAIAASVNSGAGAAAVSAGPKVQAKGLDPSRPGHLEYSAPDESGGVVRGDLDDSDDVAVAVDPNASRAERRRAERAQRKGSNRRR